MSTKRHSGRVRSVYAFIKAHRGEYSVETMCRVLGVAPSGYYKWLQRPVSKRDQADARLLRLIRASFVASHGIYGAPRIFLDLREAGETCSKHRVARLMREAKLRALHGYRTRRWSVGKPAVLIPNLVQRRFTVSKPNAVWVTDITYIRTWQGWLYLAVAMDLFSRRSAGWRPGPPFMVNSCSTLCSWPCVAGDHAARSFIRTKAPNTAATPGGVSAAPNAWYQACAERGTVGTTPSPSRSSTA